MKNIINFIHDFFSSNNFNLKKYFRKYKMYFIILLVIIISLRIGSSIYKFNYKYINSYKLSKKEVMVINKEKATGKCISYLVKLKENNTFLNSFILNIYIDENDTNIKESNKEMLFFNRFGNYVYGDILEINSKITIPTKLNNLYEFDYKKYLNSKNIIGILNTSNVKYIFRKKSIINYIYDFKNNTLDTYIDKKMGNYAPLFKSMIYGEDIDLDILDRDKFQNIGLSHMLAISGTSIFVITYILSYIFNKIKISNILSSIVTNIFIIIFCILCNNSISILRATLVSVISNIFNIYNISLNKYAKHILCIIVIFLYNPCIVFSASFKLAMVSSFGMSIFSMRISNYLNLKIIRIIGLNLYKKYSKIKIESIFCYFKLNRFKDLKKYIIYSILKYLSKVYSIYISVQLLLFPLQIYYFTNFSVISILSNLVIFYFSFFQIVLGILFIMFINFKGINNILFNLNYLSIFCIDHITNIIQNINTKFLNISFVKPNILCIICYYIIVFLLFCSDKIIYNLKYVKIKKFSAKKIVIPLKLLVIILCSSYIIYFNVYTKYFSSFVYYFNVGQGNMCLIKHKQKTILVDIGSVSNNYVASTLTNFLKAYNITKIDYILLTHFHEDHVNGIIDLANEIENGKIKVDTFVFANEKVNTNDLTYNDLNSYLNKYSIKKLIVKEYDNIKIDNDIIIDILNVNSSKIIVSDDRVNSNSAIYLITIGDKNHLFMGDATIESEEYILDSLKDNINRDYYFNKLKNLKSYSVGHHGSNTSSSYNFLKKINSSYYVISSKKSVYGHPSDEVIDKFNSLKFRYYITESTGGIMIK